MVYPPLTQEEFEAIAPRLHDDLRRDTDAYAREVQEGLDRAAVFLAGKVAFENPVPSVDDLKEAHVRAYGEVFRDAGELRTEDHPVPDVADNNKVWEPTFSENIERDLEKLTTEARQLFADAKTEQEVAQAIAYYHVGLEVIQPFPDDNGRLVLAVAEAQSEHLLNRPLNLQLGDEKSYALAITAAREKDDLALTAAVLLGTELDAEHRQSPQRVEVWPQDIHRELPNGLPIRLVADNLKDAAELATKELSPDIGRYLDRFESDKLALRDSGPDNRIELADKCWHELQEALQRDQKHGRSL